jgi:hypothetical protein
VLVLACLVGLGLLEPACIPPRPALFAALPDRLPLLVWVGAPCAAAVLVSFDELALA